MQPLLCSFVWYFHTCTWTRFHLYYVLTNLNISVTHLYSVSPHCRFPCWPPGLSSVWVFLPGNAVLELGHWALVRLGSESTCPECPQGHAAMAVFMGQNPAGTAWDRLSLYCLSSHPKALCMNWFLFSTFSRVRRARGRSPT